MADAALAAQRRHSVFQALRPTCASLMQLRDKPADLHAALSRLQQVLAAADPMGLQGCIDYVAFPLLLMVDSIVHTRKRPSAAPMGPQDVANSRVQVGAGSSALVPHGRAHDIITDENDEETGGTGDAVGAVTAVPCVRSDHIAEAVLGCMLALLSRCSLADADQLLSLLQRLLPLLQLQPNVASDELRAYAFRCVAAALQGAASMATSSAATCGSSSSNSYFQPDVTPEEQQSGGVKVEQLPQASTSQRASSDGIGGAPHRVNVLATAPCAALVGFVVHSCLAAAEVEIGRGAQGSRDAFRSALLALRQTLLAVHDADALAFFLPGIVSGLAKLVAALSGSLGPPAASSAISGGALTLALETLTLAAVSTLGDTASADVAPTGRTTADCLAGGDGPLASTSEACSLHAQGGAGRTQMELAGRPPGGGAGPAADVLPSVTALAVLRQLASRQRRGDGAERGEVAAGGTAATAGGPVAGTAVETLPELPPTPTGQLRVQRTPEWFTASSTRVVRALEQLLPPLAGHTRQAVRLAVAGSAVRLLGECQRMLAGRPAGGRALLEVVLTLAQDEWPQVAEPCREFLSGTTRGPALSSRPFELAGVSLQDVLQRSADGLYAAVRSSEAGGTLHARRLAMALLLAGPAGFESWTLRRPAALSDLLAALARCFAVTRDGMPSLERSRLAGGTYVAALDPTTPGIAASSTSAAAAGSASSSSTAVTLPSLGADKGTRHGVDQSPSHPTPTQAAAEHAGAATATISPAAAAAAATVSPQLPRAPPGLVHLVSGRSYQAVADVARCLGHLARLADAPADSSPGSAAPATAKQYNGHNHLLRTLDTLLGQFRCVQTASPPEKGAAAEVSAAAQAPTDPPHTMGGPRSSPAASAAASNPWQYEAAAAAAVSAELIYGASAAWQPAWQPAPQQQSTVARNGAAAAVAAAAAATSAASLKESDTQFSSVVLQLLEALTRDNGGWHLATYSQPGAAAGVHAGTQMFLGDNALLVRVLLDSVGTCARAAGRRFVSDGRLLRAVLVPVLERLGDPCALVADAADTALAAICAHCGCGPLPALLAANSDYVIDALCGQLRDLPSHPRAPHLMAALLQRAGVAPALLPLLAEPLRTAVQGVSILSRRQHSDYVHPFLLCLIEVATAAGQEARAVAPASAHALQTWTGRAQAREAELCLAAEAREAAAAAETGGGGGVGAREYFLARLAAKGGGDEAAAAAAAAAAASGLRGEALERALEDVRREEAEAEAGPAGKRLGIVMDPAEVEVTEARLRRLHAAGTLAGSAVDAAVPLMTSADLKVSLLAMHAAQLGLQALHDVGTARESDAQLVEEFSGRDSSGRPTRPETPRVLPAVAQAWPAVVAALQARHAAAVERALSLLAAVVGIAGGMFLAQRLRREAWPMLQRLLSSGSAYNPATSALGTAAEQALLLQREAPAPTAVLRLRKAVLHCLAAVCAGREGAAALRGIVWDIGQAVVPFTSGVHPTALRDAAATLLLALAQVDADAVWALVFDTLRGDAGAIAVRTPSALMPPASAPASAPPIAAPTSSLGPAASPICSLRQILPPPVGGRTSRAAAPDPDQTRLLQVVLAKVEAVKVGWHAPVAAEGAGQQVP